MTIQTQIADYIAGIAEPKLSDLQALHDAVLAMAPDAQLWFVDGRNEAGKVVSNPNIGYGLQTLGYADGSARDFYRVGLSANTSGLSVYIMGLDDKTLLGRRYGETLGKADITGYCIRFKALKAIDLEVLKSAIRFGLERQ
jgi:hypothetical protein